MRSFFKIFFASLLALLVFTLVAIFFIAGYIGGVATKNVPRIDPESVLVLDLSEQYAEQSRKNALGFINGANDAPGLFDVVRLIGRAKTDKDISGIYIMANNNPNGFAGSDEIRKALVEFKKSGKFILAHGDVISQKAYAIANVADKIYLSPQGYLDWQGYNVDYVFLKGTLEKLEIEPQIFYAGKFKSATEPLRTDKMTPENRLQTTVWLNDLYDHFLVDAAAARKIDTATLHRLANEGAIQNAADALSYKLVDALKYDDEVKDEIKAKLGTDKYDKTNFVTIDTYHDARRLDKKSGEKIALIYAEGDIVDGKGDDNSIGSYTYRSLIRKARLDKSIKAIVFRINSGGGSSLASENIWRELAIAKKEKPVIVSFGDVAASGGYYIACAADSIFSSPVTITGSIGVFGIIPNMEAFFRNKLGITFDGVKTAEYADAGSVYRPLNEREKKMLQANIDLIYTQFKQRVSEGRRIDTAFVDSIAQGRVWTGMRAKDIHLIDRFGGLQDAIGAAAAKAKLDDYRLVEYPQQTSLLEKFFGKSDPMNYKEKLRTELGADNYKIYEEMKRIKEITNTAQSRLPFQFFIR